MGKLQLYCIAGGMRGSSRSGSRGAISEKPDGGKRCARQPYRDKGELGTKNSPESHRPRGSELRHRNGTLCEAPSLVEKGS